MRIRDRVSCSQHFTTNPNSAPLMIRWYRYKETATMCHGIAAAVRDRLLMVDVKNTEGGRRYRAWCNHLYKLNECGKLQEDKYDIMLSSYTIYSLKFSKTEPFVIICKQQISLSLLSQVFISRCFVLPPTYQVKVSDWYLKTNRVPNFPRLTFQTWQVSLTHPLVSYI